MEQLNLGLIARDIHNSVSPTVYAAYGKALGRSVQYEIFNIEPEQLAAQLAYCRTHLQGFNVTMPYKQQVLAMVDTVEESAAKCGSANVVVVQNGKLVAHNTDGWGFIKALELQGISVTNKRIAMLGAGGVGVAIAYNLSVQGAQQVAVINIDLPQAEVLCHRMGERFSPVLLESGALERCATNADIFINASVMGQVGYPDFADTDFLDLLAPGAVVYDVNYSNPHALLIKAARHKGIQAFVGRSMTACQGIRAMEIWDGRAPSNEAALALINTLETAQE